MNSEPSLPTSLTTENRDKNGAQEQVIRIVVESGGSGSGRWWSRLLLVAFLFSLLLNFVLISSYGEYFNEFDGPQESYFSGSKEAKKKIAVISMAATIMPPFTERAIEQIEKARDDADVLGVVLVVDSPGGLVADSHQIYHELTLLAEKKPIYVQMKRLAASGGYYIAMGGGKQGKIFAEPTTWTGSIGVIIPHYNMVELSDKIGVKSEPLTTGEFKDSLNSFKPLPEREIKLWAAIMDDAFQRFLAVIAAGRPEMKREEIEAVATGQIFTAEQALAAGLIDEVGYLDDTIEQLKTKLGLEQVRVIEYSHPPTLADVLLGSATARSELSILKDLLQTPSPQAFYYSGSPQLPGWTMTIGRSITE